VLETIAAMSADIRRCQHGLGALRACLSSASRSKRDVEGQHEHDPADGHPEGCGGFAVEDPAEYEQSCDCKARDEQDSSYPPHGRDSIDQNLTICLLALWHSPLKLMDSESTRALCSQSQGSPRGTRLVARGPIPRDRTAYDGHLKDRARRQSTALPNDRDPGRSLPGPGGPTFRGHRLLDGRSGGKSLIACAGDHRGTPALGRSVDADPLGGTAGILGRLRKPNCTIGKGENGGVQQTTVVA
jgi:hypothetical protein